MIVSTVSAFTSRWQAYYELTKPRVVLLMLLTAVVGMCLSTPGLVSLWDAFWGTLGIGLAAGAAAAVNHVVDRHLDSKMNRTQGRPLPTGQLSAKEAIIFATVLGLLGIGILVAYVNLLTAVLTLITLVGYAIIYTMYLKRATSQNIVIGGLAGAAPPLLGWTAVTGRLDPAALILVLIIFVWTPPHFWALAIARRDEYAKTGIPMMPITHGVRYTQVQIFLYSVLLFVVSLLPFAISVNGWLYLLSAVFLSAVFLWKAYELLRKSEVNRLAMELFQYSITYLMLLFAAMLVDHYL